MFRKSHFIGAVLTSALMVGATVAEAKTLKVSHNLPTDNPAHISLEFMAKRVKELSGGDVKMRIFANAQLGTQRESVELMQNGLLDMARSNAAEMEAFEPSYSALTLPYIFESEDHYYKVLTSDVAEDVFMASKDKGFVGLAFMVDGSRSFYANKAINSPADLKGMKIRVQPSPSAIQMVELLGGAPTPISFGELYSALQQGVVDGAENNPQALVDVRHGEVAKVYSRDEHTMIPGVLMISTKVWDGLEADSQKALKTAAREMMDFHRDLYNKQTLEAIETAKTKLDVKFVEVEKGPFISAVLPMHDALSEKSPKLADLVARIKGLAK
ncbi:tripartite ATP-independent transporter solute receptor, DctP family [Pseudovibrio ascidiaceicola]|uniref:Tripartite ATP-independent transporter solute receptor, DctP family n=1 Tax=Pseudovibrio ascidiaceicola TaxID=285279 RepID=A0A1I3ZQ76_9HYPH|nr:TRAP transporter substrate-binding protein [Pseudovibrio ascidiaceicola]SFK46272.1 tripartite ATP-independent transporter solute receptor, DctP family [Pseudovibrio ascidiaceicola]